MSTVNADWNLELRPNKASHNLKCYWNQIALEEDISSIMLALSFLICRWWPEWSGGGCETGGERTGGGEEKVAQSLMRLLWCPVPLERGAGKEEEEGWWEPWEKRVSGACGRIRSRVSARWLWRALTARHRGGEGASNGVRAPAIVLLY